MAYEITWRLHYCVRLSKQNMVSLLLATLLDFLSSRILLVRIGKDVWNQDIVPDILGPDNSMLQSSGLNVEFFFCQNKLPCQSNNVTCSPLM